MLRSAVFLIVLGVYACPTSADVWTFETPSENVQCVVGEGIDSSDITCTIIERSGPPAVTRPPGCNIKGWGHTFRMDQRGPVEVLCVEIDRDQSGFSRAEYGVTGEFGGFKCYSSRKGFECRNLDGNGFFLSRRKQIVFTNGVMAKSTPGNSPQTDKNQQKEVAAAPSSPTHVPVLERGSANGLPTCTIGIVSNLRGKNNVFLAVRSGPDKKFQRVAELKNGEEVLVFDRRGDWAGVVYQTKDVECSARKIRRVPYPNQGWVHTNWLKDIAG